MTTRKNKVRIGGASGFWGDTMVAAPQLIQAGKVDYLVMDYLAELTMSIMARQRATDPTTGYASDFVDVMLKQNLRDIKERGIRVVTNAGGVNPLACRDAIDHLAAQLGIEIKVAIVVGDDILDRASTLNDVREMSSNQPLPQRLMSANAYLGATPIVAALAGGADIVITGRCVDSALVLGILMHEFAWSDTDYDLLASGSLAGHIVECGAQATGGLYTDWERVEDWAHIGFPVIECSADGSFVVEKPPRTGGLITPAVLAEQMLYEIGDPQAYLLPDVTADFSQVRVTQMAADRVQVSPARGRPPSANYKVSATYADGYRATALMCLIGEHAARKGQRTADAILQRTREIFESLKLGDYSETRVEMLGAEASFGPHARATATREVVMRMAVRHADKRALQIFLREVSPAATGMAPGTTGSFGARQSVQPVVRLFSFLLPKAQITPRVVMQAQEVPVAVSDVGGFDPVAIARPAWPDAPVSGAVRQVPLRQIAHGRSGDKGDTCNIGVIARDPAYYPALCAALTANKVGAYLAHLVNGKVERFALPGIHGMNFLLHEALGGGGMASLRVDPLGKAYAQILLDMPVEVQEGLLQSPMVKAGD